MFKPIRGYMWRAHEKNRGKPRMQAQREYISEIERMCHAYDMSQLPAELKEPAERFFEEFFATAAHPFAKQTENSAPAAMTTLLEEEKKGQLSEQAPPLSLSPAPMASSRTASRAVSPNATLATPPASSRSAANSPARPASSMNGASASPGRDVAAGGVSNASEIEEEHKTTTVPAASSSSSSSSARAHPPVSASAPPPLGDLRDKELALRLLELQQANQAKMKQLEAHMARAAASGANPAAALAARFATPARGSVRGVAGSAVRPTFDATPVSSCSGFLSLDSSSPFSSAWTPNGLTAHHSAAGLGPGGAEPRSAALASPETPFQPFHTPYANGRATLPPRVVEAVPYGLHTNAVATPRTSFAEATRRGAEATMPDEPLPSAAAASAPSSSSVSSQQGAISGSELDTLLSSLDAKHAAQVSHFQQAEARWAAKLAAMQAQHEAMQRIIDNNAQPAVTAPASSSDDSAAAAAAENAVAAELKLSLTSGSLLHGVLQAAKVVVPVGVAAYAAFRIWREVERRARR
jgi:hypothetical protein